VIVNHCQWRDTIRLTRQIRQTSWSGKGVVEVVIVDNRSPPHPIISRLRRMHGVSLRRWRRNHGFARAVNEGCRLSRGQWVLLLNPDITLEHGFLDGVMNLAARLSLVAPGTGIVGFHLRHGDGTLQRSSGRFPTLARTLGRLLLPRHRRKYGSPPLDRPSEVSWVTGCCLLVRKECLEQVGGFDEDYFLYYEDVDFCRRARLYGWSVRYEPRWRVVHHQPLHARPVPFPIRLYTRHALLTYASKHWRPWQFRLLAAIVRLETRIRQRWALAHDATDQASQWQQLVALTRDLARGRPAAARRRLDRIVKSQERKCVSRSNTRRSSQPAEFRFAQPLLTTINETGI
jgi:GT2 family glycosyltransferase